MPEHAEIEAFLRGHLEFIMRNDIEAYHRSTSPDLTLYEWWVTPHRIDGLPFHDFMMESNAARGKVFGAKSADGESPGASTSRFDLSNLKIQHYGDAAIASYTLLISTASEVGVSVASHNESRVMVRKDGAWQVVHVHKSPAWAAPHTNP
jgi:hypothetical protein